MTESQEKEEVRSPSLADAIVPLVALAVFFNIFSPALSVIYGFTGFKIVKTPSAQEAGGPL